MTSTVSRYAKAAQALPMAWLTQFEFPAKALVEQSFVDAITDLHASDNYGDNLVRSALEAIVSGIDPRGTFKAQAIQAAAQPHDRLSCSIGDRLERRCVCETDVLPLP